MSTVTIMQPAYLPWLGFFDRIARSDTFIVLDHVSIDKNTKTQFSNRNQIKTAQGPLWLSIPVQARGGGEWLPLNRIPTVHQSRWARKHATSLRTHYAKARFFNDYFDGLAALLPAEEALLMDVTEPVNRWLLGALGISRKILYSSAMDPQTSKSELVLELCRKAGATSYISGPFGRDYLDIERFREAGIEVLFHDYAHPVYRQLHGDFAPYMSIVDLLFNEGPDALSILTSDPNTLATR